MIHIYVFIFLLLLIFVVVFAFIFRKKDLNESFISKRLSEQNLLGNSSFEDGKNIREFQETFDDAHYHIDRNANSKILFTQLCFQTMRYIHVA